MPTLPINIVNIASGAGFTNGIVNGKIEGDIKAGINLTGSVCHGLQIGIGGQIAGRIAGNAALLFIGGKAQGQLSAEAGAKVLVRLEPNLFNKMGLVVEAGAYAYAAAAGSLAVYLTPEFFARYIQDHLDDFSSDLFLIFLEEIEAEIGVWGKVAVAAMAEGHLNLILDIRHLNSGFEISGGGNIGLEAGGGYDFYCRAGFKNLRRAIKRSTLRINEEIGLQIRRSGIPNAPLLIAAFDFTFPLIVLLAYDIGNESYQKKALLQPAQIADIVLRNFVENLQRFAVDKLTEAAVDWLSGEFSRLYYRLAGIQLSESELEQLENELSALLEILQKGDFRVDDINGLVTRTINVLDLLDDVFLDPFKQPLTVFWLSGMLGLQARELFAEFYAGGIISTAGGGASVNVATDLLPDAPELVKQEVRRLLGDGALEIGVGQAVDYLIEVGVSLVLDRYVPEFRPIRERLHTAFNMTEGQVVEDVLNILAGRGSLDELNSYGAVKQFVKTELLDGLLLNELLPLIREQAGSETLGEYLDEVIEPSIHSVSEFVFGKLDDILLGDLQQLNEEKLLQMTESLSTGCGIVVYQVLVRNVLFFDEIVNDFILDNTYQGFRSLRQDLENPNHPFFISSRNLFEENLPGKPDLAPYTEAFQTLLYDMAAAFEEVFGPVIHTPQRRSRIKNLKRSILLSIGGRYNYSQTMLPELAIEELINCAHIPNLAAVQQLSAELIEISLETFSVFAERIVPALGDFYLAITLQQFRTLRENLNQYIDGLLEAANRTLDDYEKLAAEIRDSIRVTLTDIEALIAKIRTDIENYLDGDWAAQAKAAVKVRGEANVREGTPDGNAETAAVLTFQTVDWLVIDPVLDFAFEQLHVVVDHFFDTLEDIAGTGSDAAQDFLDWQENLEEQLIEDLQNMIIIPAAETARIIMDILIPPSLITIIEDYLVARQDQKTLEADEHDKDAQLLLLETIKEEQDRKYQGNRHKSSLALKILNPVKNFEFIYPASVEVLLLMQHGSSEFILNPQSRRIQLMLNGRPMETGPEYWHYRELSDSFELIRGFQPEDFKSGVNLLELSWITGAEEGNTRREVVAFLVDPDAFYPSSDLEISFQYDPSGSDPVAEYVQINWKGNEALDMSRWRMMDLAGHRYIFPELLLQQNDSLKIYTGGDPADNITAPGQGDKKLHMGRGKAIWNNEGDVLYLVDTHSVLVRSASY